MEEGKREEISLLDVLEVFYYEQISKGKGVLALYASNILC